MGIDVGWFVTDSGVVIEQILEADPLPIEELLILPTTSNCDKAKIKKVNNAATDFLVPYYEGNILLA